ncbi:hypothetical protein ONZ45_g10369 [Pleurotus djamor]|nr:hypothetical protein ONZ45_g10369 [Pleurotus djamor]
MAASPTSTAPLPKRTGEQHQWLNELEHWSSVEPQDLMDSILRQSFKPLTGQPTEWAFSGWLRPILTDATFPAGLSHTLLNECELRPGKELVELWLDRDSPADFIVRAYRRKNMETLLDRESTLSALSQAFDEPPIGDICQRFLKDVDFYRTMSTYPDPSSRTIHLTNSSGSGKSYLVKILANEASYLTVSVSIISMVDPDPSDPPTVDWPPSDKPACDFFREQERIRANKGEELVGVFIGSLFSVMADILQESGTLKEFNKHWKHVYHSEHVAVRANEAFEVSVRERTLQGVVDQALEMLEATPWLDLHDQIDTSESSIYCWCDSIFQAVVKPHLERLCQLTRSLLPDGRIFIAFEGLSELVTWGCSSDEPSNRITMFAFKRIYATCLNYSPCWFLILGRHVDCSALLPPRNPEQSILNSPLPPWPYFDYDLMVQEAFKQEVSPREALSLGHLKYYGRPLWSRLHGHLDLIKFGISKLILRAYWLQPDTSAFAMLSARVLPRLMHGSFSASRLASTSVRDHMRTLCWDEKKSLFSTLTPSEPILSLAAAVYMLDEQVADNYAQYQNIMDTAVQYLILPWRNILEKGSCGGLMARLYLTIARDAALGDKPFVDPTGVGQKVTAVTVNDFFKNLVPSCVHKKLPQELHDYVVNFSHFAQLSDDLSVLTSQLLHHACCYILAIKTRFKKSPVSNFTLQSLTIPTLYGSSKVEPTTPTGSNRPTFIPTTLDKLKHVVVLMDMCISPEDVSTTHEPAAYDPGLKLPWHSRAMHYSSDPEEEPFRWCIHIKGHGATVYPVVEKLGPSLFHADIWRRVPIEDEALLGK